MVSVKIKLNGTDNWAETNRQMFGEVLPRQERNDEPTVEVLNPLGCELHGMIEGGGNDCVRCENAQYNGSEIDRLLDEAGISREVVDRVRALIDRRNMKAD